MRGGTISSGHAAGILRRSLMSGIRGAAVQSGGGDAGPAKASTTFALPRLQPGLIFSLVHQLKSCNNVTPAPIVALRTTSASPHNHQLNSIAVNG